MTCQILLVLVVFGIGVCNMCTQTASCLYYCSKCNVYTLYYSQAWFGILRGSDALWTRQHTIISSRTLLVVALYCNIRLMIVIVHPSVTLLCCCMLTRVESSRVESSRVSQPRRRMNNDHEMSKEKNLRVSFCRL
jgi:hypothetical protein